MVAPQLPHPLREMRVEVTVKNRVARREVAVTRPAVVYLVGERSPRRDRLRIVVGRILVARTLQPLVSMEVEYVRLFRPRVNVPETHGVAYVRVMHVRRVVGEERLNR